jgi:23S rRNA (guanosine2251-2'-O)-methyltransferase
LLFGSEGFGMRKHSVKYTDFLVKIDINKKIESLNISNSAAIVFHHLNFLKKNVE